MKKEELTLDHKSLLYEKLRHIDTSISEYSFSNLYLFRELHKYSVIFDKEVFIEGITYDYKSYIMPTGNPMEISIEYLKTIMKDYDYLFPIDEKWLSHFKSEDFKVTADDGETDYIHSIEKMSSYPGKKLHKKRNLLKQFLSRYEYEALPLTNERLNDARIILKEWQEELDLPPEGTDFHECSEAIDLYETLVLCGGIYYVEEEPAAFIIGEEINETHFALHFAKARRKFKGIYQFIFNNFAKIMPSKYCCFNFEQDLGMESLRQAKSTYIPDNMVKKYRVSI